MSLKDGTKKMSKSDPSDLSRINLKDTKDEIINKIKKAKTDNDPMPVDESNLNKRPEIGDVVVFKTPVDNRTDYIKRLIGMPGDTIQFIDGLLYINDLEIFKDIKSDKDIIFCGDKTIDVNTFEEKLSDKTFKTVYGKYYTFQNSQKFIVPDKHYFFLGDNRDCSKDSRFLSSVGYVHENNLVGKAQFIFFSSDTRKGSIFEIWRWHELIRIDRFFKKIK